MDASSEDLSMPEGKGLVPPPSPLAPAAVTAASATDAEDAEPISPTSSPSSTEQQQPQEEEGKVSPSSMASLETTRGGDKLNLEAPEFIPSGAYQNALYIPGMCPT